jgi:hypothetical protein
MSFNRTKYDECAYNLQMGRSRDPGNYRLAPEFAENCNQCFSATGPVGGKADVSTSKKIGELTFGSMAETESHLSWRNQSLNKCNILTQPFSKSQVNHKPVCSNKLTPEDTRFTFPIDNYRGMSLTSYMVSPYLPVNPQCHIQDSCDTIGLNSRLAAKDTYKLPKAQMWDKGEALPKPN